MQCNGIPQESLPEWKEVVADSQWRTEYCWLCSYRDGNGCYDFQVLIKHYGTIFLSSNKGGMSADFSIWAIYDERKYPRLPEAHGEEKVNMVIRIFLGEKRKQW